MKKLLSSLLLSLLLAGAATAGSTVNPSAPGDRSGLTSLTVRNNFAAAYQDINNILGVFAGTTAPTTPTNLQSWADYSTSPVVVFRYWNATTGTWVPYSLLNINTGVVTPYMASGGFVANAPVTVSVTGGVATFGMALDSNFVVRSGQLGLSNQFYGHMMANCTGNPNGEPGDCSWSQFADIAISAVNGSLPYRTGGSWLTANTGASGHAIPFLDVANTWSAAQVVYGGGGNPTSAQPGTLYRAVALDGTVSNYQADSFASNGGFTCMRAENTLVSPQAVANNSVICQFGGGGYNSASYQGSRVGMRTYAAQTWSVGANGTRAGIFTTPNGGVATADMIGFENDGGVTIPPTVTGGSKGAGTVNVGGALYNNGVLISGTGTVTSATIAAGTGVSLAGTCVITSSGSCTINNTGVLSFGGASGNLTAGNGLSVVGSDVRFAVPVTTPNGGTGVVSPATHTIPVNQGASAQTNTGTGTSGQCVVSNGASADPSFKSGCRVLLNTLSGSGTATLLDTTSFTAAYDEYEIVIENLVPSTASVDCRIKVFSGSVQSTSYVSVALFSAGAGVSNSAITTYIPCSGNGGRVGNGSSQGVSGNFTLHGLPTGTVSVKMLHGTSFYPADTFTGGGYWAVTSAITGLQFDFSAGNINSGSISIYGKM